MAKQTGIIKLKGTIDDISLGATELCFLNIQFMFLSSNTGIIPYDPVEIPTSSLMTIFDDVN